MDRQIPRNQVGVVGEAEAQFFGDRAESFLVPEELAAREIEKVRSDWSLRRVEGDVSSPFSVFDEHGVELDINWDPVQKKWQAVVPFLKDELDCCGVQELNPGLKFYRVFDTFVQALEAWEIGRSNLGMKKKYDDEMVQ